MRSKKELYQLVLENFKNKNFRGFGFICNNIDFCKQRGLITFDEHKLLLSSFKRQRPNARRHKEFFVKDISGEGWWDLSDESILKRIKFLEKLIENS